MSSRKTPTGFSILDLYTRIIPGAALLIAFFLPRIIVYYYVEGQFPELPVESIPIGLLLFALLSLVLGEFIDVLRRSWFPVPRLFRRMVYDETGDRNNLNWSQRRLLGFSETDSDFRIKQRIASFFKREVWDVRRGNFRWAITSYGKIEMSNEEPDAGFLEYYRKQMDFSSTFSDSRILYLSLYTYLDGQMSSPTKQYQTAYNAVVNSQLAVIGSILLLSFNIFDGILQDDLPLQIFAGIMLVLILVLYPLFTMYAKIFTRIEREYIESLLLEYLMTERSQ